MICKRFHITLFLCLTVVSLMGNCYWLSLRDKQGTQGDMLHPETFLSERALQNRQRQNIPIDSLDLPVSQFYADSIARIGAEILYSSRWHNALTVRVTRQEVLERLEAVDFITAIELTEDTLYAKNIPLLQPRRRKTIVADSIDYGKSRTQIEMLHLDKLHQEGYLGEGVLIAIADDGFYNAHTIDALHGAYERTVYTRDFVAKDGDVYQQGTHGTMVLSCIAAESSDMLGTAPAASFALMRTEDDLQENYREMDNLCAAFETADSIGADLISVSLGYLDAFDSPDMTMSYSQLDGKQWRATRSAAIAARKGMIVCLAAGNEGNTDWHYINVPSDADGIICVGAVDEQGKRSSFSSFGPTADGRIKPDLCALGSNCAVIDANSGNCRSGSGTSFATPVLAGAIACLRQALPEKSNMEIIGLLRESASQYSTPDCSLGYGIPNLWTAYRETVSTTNEVVYSVPTHTALLYNLQGQCLGQADAMLAMHGVYIIKAGNQVRKVVK